ncbi:MAG: hypothetical protein ACI9S8_001961, partial [Chlamydiales bacterium]
CVWGNALGNGKKRSLALKERNIKLISSCRFEIYQEVMIRAS